MATIEQSLDLEWILKEKTYTFIIANPVDDNNTLASITETNTDGLTLSYSGSLPLAFTNLEEKSFTITVNNIGIRDINAQYLFTFDNDYVVLTVVGRRQGVWPFIPIYPITISKEWLTYINDSVEGEERFSLRDVARENVKYNCILINNEEYANAKAISSYFSYNGLAIPDWINPIKLTTPLLGSSTLVIDTEFLELSNDDYVILWKDYKTFEINRITLVEETQLTFETPFTENIFPGYLLKLKISNTPTNVDFSIDGTGRVKVSIDFTNLLSYNDETYWAASETYLSIPVLTQKPCFSGSIAEKFSRIQSSLDFDLGTIDFFDNEEYTRFNQTISFVVKSDKFTYNRMFDYLRGKYNVFWLPSFNKDLIYVTQPLAGDLTIDVYTNGWQVTNLKYLQLIGDVNKYVKISTIEDNLDGTSTITLTATIPAGINNITVIRALAKMRLNSDRIDFNYNTRNLLLISAPVVEVIE